jgi:hypothetical protein
MNPWHLAVSHHFFAELWWALRRVSGIIEVHIGFSKLTPTSSCFRLQLIRPYFEWLVVFICSMHSIEHSRIFAGFAALYSYWKGAHLRFVLPYLFRFVRWRAAVAYPNAQISSESVAIDSVNECVPWVFLGSGLWWSGWWSVCAMTELKWWWLTPEVTRTISTTNTTACTPTS